jgi:hypothetical protein
MHDVLLAVASMVFERFSLLAFALLLQRPWAQKPAPRWLAGILMCSAILVIQRYIYFTPTQTLGLHCASAAVLAAFAVLHWTFLEDPNRKPTVMEVGLSPAKHVLAGVIKAHQRSLKQQAQPSNQPGNSPSVWSLLHEAVVTWLICAASHEVGQYFLCYFGNGMCISTYSSHSWPASCAFSFAAALLLTQQLEVGYGPIRIALIILGFRFPMLAELAAQMPTRAFKWPVAAASVSEFWSMRWHQFLRFYFQGLGGAAVNTIFPNASATLRTSMQCVAVFVISGLMHEYLLWAVFDAASGRHLAFFMLNCVVVLVENSKWVQQLLSACMPRKWLPPKVPVDSSVQPSTVTAQVTSTARGAGIPAGIGSNSNNSASNGTSANSSRSAAVPVWLKHAWALSFFTLLAPLFLEPFRKGGLFAERAFYPFGIPVAPTLFSWVQV